MAGHNKWSKVKHKKKKLDAERSKVFSKLVKQIQTEAKRCGGDTNDPGLQSAIEQAKAADMPKENIKRAIERAITDAEGSEWITYECYGPGGVGIVIEAYASNRNKSAAEIRHILSEFGTELAKPGAVTWAFEKSRDEDNNPVWTPTSETPVSDEDRARLDKIIEALEANEEVEGVFTNAQIAD